MDPAGLPALIEAIRHLHGCEATWVESLDVHEKSGDETVWEGDVQVFDVKGHPKATRVYAWSHATTGTRADTVVDYLWGEPAAHAMMSLLTAREDRSKALNWVQIGSVAGATMALPSVALRSANLRVMGSGQFDAGHRRGASPSCRRTGRRAAGRQHQVHAALECRNRVGCRAVRRETHRLCPVALQDMLAQKVRQVLDGAIGKAA
jgi:hypothetical protein